MKIKIRSICGLPLLNGIFSGGCGKPAYYTDLRREGVAKTLWRDAQTMVQLLHNGARSAQTQLTLA